MYPEALLAGFDCVPNSLHFGKYHQSRYPTPNCFNDRLVSGDPMRLCHRFAEETLERQPGPVRQILESTMRKFNFGPGTLLPTLSPTQSNLDLAL